MALSAVTISAAGTREKACQRSDADGLDLLATPSGGQGSESGMAIFGELARRASIARSRHRIGGKAEAQVRVVEKTHPRAQAAPAQPRQSPDLLCQQSRRPLRALLPPVSGRPGQDQCRTRTVHRRHCRNRELATCLDSPAVEGLAPGIRNVRREIEHVGRSASSVPSWWSSFVRSAIDPPSSDLRGGGRR
jgi:hypothetical protein